MSGLFYKYYVASCIIDAHMQHKEKLTSQIVF